MVSLVAYSLVATYSFWMMRHDLRFLERRIAGAKADISKLETAYETLRLLVERTGKHQAEALSIIAEANKRIDRLEDKRTYKPNASPSHPTTPARQAGRRKEKQLTSKTKRK